MNSAHQYLYNLFSIADFVYSHEQRYTDTVARDILLAFTMLSDDFNPADQADMKYLWDVWFSVQWSESTRKRFVKDVKQLWEGKWSPTVLVPDPENVEKLKTVFKEWLKIACNFPANILDKLARSMY